MFSKRVNQVAHLGYNDGFTGEQEFCIPKEAKLNMTSAQKSALNFRELGGLSTFAPEVENQESLRPTFRIDANEKSVRELFAILKQSQLHVAYTAAGEHQIVKDADTLINLIQQEKELSDKKYAEYRQMFTKA